jgi:PAS domain S-box-containing protein
MKSSPRLLLLEDESSDALLIRRRLRVNQFDCDLVIAENKAQFIKALAKGGFDLVLADYFIPGFDGLSAMAIARERCPGVPFIFVSGAIGDQVAVESLRAGATDYVLKDRLVKLVPAIQRALAEAEESARRKASEAQLERSIRQHETLVNTVDGIVWQADLPALRFTFVSQQAERILGYPVSSWLEDPKFWPEHIHPEDRAKAISLCTSLTAQEKYKQFEYRMVAADGRVVWLRDLVSLTVENRESPQLAGLMVDITRRKEAEEKVRRIRDRLRQTNQDLLAKNQEIQNFYHTLSHELKTPLTSAREFISLVMDGVAGPLNPTQSEYLAIAKDSCDQLRVCINDLMDATRLETGKLALELKSAPLGPLLQRVLTAMGPAATAKQIALSLELEPQLPEVFLDENRINQVVTNLVNNALKFTPPGGKIVVGAASASSGPDAVRVFVSDTGRGIPQDEQSRIFDRLYQVKAGDATTEQGVGLGLYLCRELVQLHGGNVWVDSEPGCGSTFSFVLPRNQPACQSADLLVIDDAPDARQMLYDLLSAERYNVRTACDGAEALQQMQHRVPDLVLLDLSMPKLDGPATLKEIRKNWGAIPIIVHTGYTDSDLMKRALEFSPFTLLAKPCAPDQILETVRKVQHSEDTAIWRRKHFALEKSRLRQAA